MLQAFCVESTLVAKHPEQMDLNLAKLGRFVADHFDPDHLQALCLELDLPYDQLLGDTHSARAFDLVTLVRDRGQLSALLAAIATARPDTFDPGDFETKSQRERAWRWGVGWSVGGGVILVLLAAFVFLSNRRTQQLASTSSVVGQGEQVSARMTATLTPTRPRPTMSPSPTVVAATPSSVPATPTDRPASTPLPSATRTPVPSFTPSVTATPSPTPLSTATPVLSPSSAALSYDAETRTLRLAMGDASLRRARLCTPLNAYQRPEVLYFIDSVADSLGLPLPARARVTHTDPDLPEGSVVRTLEVRRHPVQGVKVTGEEADFTGCDLVVSEALRQSLGFPVSLGEFDDPPRFEHGWVTIEFLGVP